MKDKPVGTCSICGGAVCVPSVWFGIFPPTPTCNGCGATPKNAWGPVIPMEPSGKDPIKYRINSAGTLEEIA